MDDVVLAIFVLVYAGMFLGEIPGLAVDRTGLEAARKFLDSINVKSLKLYADPTTRSGSALRAVGMPTTILIDPEGREIGRLPGPAGQSRATKTLPSKSSLTSPAAAKPKPPPTSLPT